LSHSKYETVTPPAFAIKSGRTGIFFSSKIYCALKVTGPFAPSAINLH